MDGTVKADVAHLRQYEASSKRFTKIRWQQVG